MFYTSLIKERIDIIVYKINTKDSLDENANGVYVMHSEKGLSIWIRELVDYCKQEEIERFYR
ncbi:hypothetical protein B0H39_005994 [Clostridium beijerinckii]|uniref:hypothetical protein n=1 Tax=Clostridium beijerinckii TaxID=1520 RepID=UPI00149436EE|nr:hypothetical protein [Clostridium beijerinckii]NOW87963.1 hypothetical protein [Clostridium beijerinckii]